MVCFCLCFSGVAVTSTSNEDWKWGELLRPTDGWCFCLRALLWKPQQNDGRYWDRLIIDTLTFKAASLCGGEWILHHILSTPHHRCLGGAAASVSAGCRVKACGSAEGSQPGKTNCFVSFVSFIHSWEEGLWSEDSLSHGLAAFSAVQSQCLSLGVCWRCAALPPPLSVGQLGPGCVGCCCMLRERESVWKLCRRG